MKSRARHIGIASVDVSDQARPKEQAMLRIIPGLIGSILLLAGCATTDGRMATDEDRARCAEMEKDMGPGTPHDHAGARGGGESSMNLSHDRCVKILASPG